MAVLAACRPTSKWHKGEGMKRIGIQKEGHNVWVCVCKENCRIVLGRRAAGVAGVVCRWAGGEQVCGVVVL